MNEGRFRFCRFRHTENVRRRPQFERLDFSRLQLLLYFSLNTYAGLKIEKQLCQHV